MLVREKKSNALGSCTTVRNRIIFQLYYDNIQLEVLYSVSSVSVKETNEGLELETIKV